MRSPFVRKRKPKRQIEHTLLHKTHSYTHSLTHACMQYTAERERIVEQNNSHYKNKHNASVRTERKKTIIVSVLFEIQQFYINGNCIEKN